MVFPQSHFKFLKKERNRRFVYTISPTPRIFFSFFSSFLFLLVRNSWKIESRWSLSEVCSWAADSLQGRRGAVLSGSGGNEPVGGHRSKGERLCQCGCPRSGRQDGSGRGGGKERAGSEEEDSLSNKNPGFADWPS